MQAESDVRAEYDPQIEEARQVIERALRYLTRDDQGLKEAIGRKQDEEMRLMVRKERLVLRCWRGYRERWE